MIVTQTHLNDLLGVQPEVKVPKDKIWDPLITLVRDPEKHRDVSEDELVWK